MLGIVYNSLLDENEIIKNDSKKVFKKHLQKLGYQDVIIEIPLIDFNKIIDIDFSALFASKSI